MVFRAFEGPVRLELEMPGAVFDEGSRIEATIVVTATRDASVLGGEIELAWHRAYHYRQGTDVWGPYATATGRSSNVGDRVVLKPLGHLSPGDRISQRVALRVPAHGPGSVRTGLVDLQWEVTARLRVEKARTTEVTRPVLVLSEAADREQVTERPPTVEEHQCAGLSFTSLSSRRLVPGVALDGELTVAPLKACDVRGIRVELVLLEHVARGPRASTDPLRNPAYEEADEEMVVASVALADRPELDPARPLTFRFSVPVPDRLPAPSMRTEEFSLRWMLRGVVDRPLRADPCVAVEMHGVTMTLRRFS
jgi:hypothetical protein